ncbi:hypothetical protein GIB67_023854 [Kingdonia uniflora]|uniref:Uncharacterized protein n=1 Tax=Kingdonia uniflora TaxID=39325 RepID=A0A7J7NGJ4_9MAGN|nr:hypothetical protein GIB67_023854 [Kingdonia uniflora]
MQENTILRYCNRHLIIKKFLVKNLHKNGVCKTIIQTNSRKQASGHTCISIYPCRLF